MSLFLSLLPIDSRREQIDSTIPASLMISWFACFLLSTCTYLCVLSFSFQHQRLLSRHFAPNELVSYLAADRLIGVEPTHDCMQMALLVFPTFVLLFGRHLVLLTRLFLLSRRSNLVRLCLSVPQTTTTSVDRRSPRLLPPCDLRNLFSWRVFLFLKAHVLSSNCFQRPSLHLSPSSSSPNGSQMNPNLVHSFLFHPNGG